jgi:hypothetical protein
VKDPASLKDDGFDDPLPGAFILGLDHERPPVADDVIAKAGHERHYPSF